MKRRIAAWLGAAALGLSLMMPAGAAERGQVTIMPTAAQAGARHVQRETFSAQEIIDAGHKFFGTTTKGLARAVESVFARQGRPSGYILGEEASGAFIGGLRYGEGWLYLKNGQRRKVFWQGPSIGFDAGGNGSRVLMLVYDIDSPRQILGRFPGVNGSAYVVGGLDISVHSNQQIIVVPIRTGVGARLGANMGYLKFTARPTWNPF
ncbi:DUF1134 domain-containing protein [Thermopetrobacter sp. TC1]|uniref:DUF1134 domain-containing protein n=1 Tax=Thermopetrobacter sp. TC1 TaxID=1495045 RepID=UPI0005708B9E|nr:DUF1134 domain-containing protein [Thermopetrobacter sp. TC1]